MVGGDSPRRVRIDLTYSKHYHTASSGSRNVGNTILPASIYCYSAVVPTPSISVAFGTSGIWLVTIARRKRWQALNNLKTVSVAVWGRRELLGRGSLKTWTQTQLSPLVCRSNRVIQRTGSNPAISKPMGLGKLWPGGATAKSAAGGGAEGDPGGWDYDGERDQQGEEP